MTRFIEFTGGDVEAYLQAQENKDLLRFITCGSVDDGKSTLIGRLLYESKMLFEDQLSALEADSKKLGTQGGNLDFALLVDGLAAEREQGITIDVAYRAFTTDKRKFIVADTPGHEQYTRNMATGASTADLAIILIDARKGVLTQTRRHTFICHAARHPPPRRLPSTRWTWWTTRKDVFDKIEADYRAFAQVARRQRHHRDPGLGPGRRQRHRRARRNMPWYHGPTLMAHLETVPVGDDLRDQALPPAGAMGEPPQPEFPRLLRHHRLRHACKPGDAIKVAAVGQDSPRSTRIVTYRRRPRPRPSPARRSPSRSTDEIDVSRGDVLCAAKRARRSLRPVRGAHPVDGRRSRCCRAAPISSRPAPRHVPGTHRQAQVQGQRQHHGACGGQDARRSTRSASATSNSTRRSPSRPTTRTATLGSFIIIDRFTNNTVGMGLIHFALRRAANIHWQATRREQGRRAQRSQGQKPAVLWFTGLSGAGKSTIANLVEKKLHAEGQHHLPARRRQCAPRPQPRSRLHRCRPRREHPPRRRSGEADGRCRTDRARLLHLALPRRAPDGARTGRATASSSRSSSTRRWPRPRSAT